MTPVFGCQVAVSGHSLLSLPCNLCWSAPARVIGVVYPAESLTTSVCSRPCDYDRPVNTLQLRWGMSKHGREQRMARPDKYILPPSPHFDS